MSVKDISNLYRLRTLLMRAWDDGQIITILPGEMDVLDIILEDRGQGVAVIEHPRMELPDERSLITALVEGLERAFEEVDRG
jgi:hypothetical protein